MKKLLLIQPGAYGDIFLCAPIAKWYFDKGYQVDWPVAKRFLSTLSYFDYVNPIELSEEILHSDWLRSDVMKIIPMIDSYDKVLNLADRGPHSTIQMFTENFEQCKYRIAEVPFDEKHNLKWTRNLDKENALFTKLNITSPYAVVHNVDSKGGQASIPLIHCPVVQVKEIQGYSILDWYSVFLNAQEIYCVESSVQQFIDGFIKSLSSKNYLLKRPILEEGRRFTISSNWRLDYIGINSTVKG